MTTARCTCDTAVRVRTMLEGHPPTLCPVHEHDAAGRRHRDSAEAHVKTLHAALDDVEQTYAYEHQAALRRIDERDRKAALTRIRKTDPLLATVIELTGAATTNPDNNDGPAAA